MSTRRPEAIAGVSEVDLTGQTVLVTGSTSGIGREAALAFGRLGADVLVHGRDAEAGTAVCDALERTAAGDVQFLQADFASLDAVRSMATTVREQTDTLDILVNNAGGLFPNGGLTDDGIAYTFGVNHLASYALTTALEDELAAADGRVITTSSRAHRGVTFDFDELQKPETGTGMTAYARSKLANILFTRELARRWDDAVTAVSLHPGAIPGSGFARHLPGPIASMIQAADRLPDAVVDRFFATPVDGAATVVYLGAAQSVAERSGEHFVECTPETPSRAARDDTTAERLWTVSERLAQSS